MIAGTAESYTMLSVSTSRCSSSRRPCFETVSTMSRYAQPLECRPSGVQTRHCMALLWLPESCRWPVAARTLLTGHCAHQISSRRLTEAAADAGPTATLPTIVTLRVELPTLTSGAARSLFKYTPAGIEPTAWTKTTTFIFQTRGTSSAMIHRTPIIQ